MRKLIIIFVLFLFVLNPFSSMSFCQECEHYHYLDNCVVKDCECNYNSEPFGSEGWGDPIYREDKDISCM